MFAVLKNTFTNESILTAAKIPQRLILTIVFE